MILDTSAVLAVLFAEPDAQRYADAIGTGSTCAISAANYFESAMLIDSRGDEMARAGFERFFPAGNIAIVPVTLEQAMLARQAHRQFGKGRGHPARLNYGDCFAYALAKETGEPLLFKGGDFALTDIRPAL